MTTPLFDGTDKSRAQSRPECPWVRILMTVIQFVLLVTCVSAEIFDSSQNRRPVGNATEEVTGKRSDHIEVFEGDMILTKEEADEIMEHGQRRRHKRQALLNPERLWPNNVVYYSFGKNATKSAIRRFEKAIKLWSEETCVDFKKDDKASDQIVIYDWYGCASRVGRRGGKQGLYLGQQCYSVGRVAHEIGHVLGFFHTQSRPDRDDFITVLTENIVEYYRPEFTKYRKGSVDTYNLTYDYGSVMQYSAKSATLDNGPVMIPKPDKRYLETLGSPMISFYDKLMVNKRYGCLNKCTEWFRKSCKNGGFRNPRDCSKCVCPSGYGGKYCTEKPGPCGEKLRARTWYQTLNDTVGQSNYNPDNDNDEFLMCYYWIEGLPGTTIEVKLVNYSRDGYSDGCIYSGVEIKTGNDTRRTGYRFCDNRSAGTTLYSTNQIVPVITYARLTRKTTVLSYRIVASDPKTKCEDKFLCKTWLKLRPCKKSHNSDMERRLCPKSCGYCL